MGFPGGLTIRWPTTSRTPEPNAVHAFFITHQLSKIKNLGPVLLSRGRSLSVFTPYRLDDPATKAVAKVAAIR